MAIWIPGKELGMARPMVGMVGMACGWKSEFPLPHSTNHFLYLRTAYMKKHQRKLAKNDMHGRGSPSSLEARSASQFVRLKAARLFARASDLRLAQNCSQILYKWSETIF